MSATHNATTPPAAPVGCQKKTASEKSTPSQDGAAITANYDPLAAAPLFQLGSIGSCHTTMQQPSCNNDDTASVFSQGPCVVLPHRPHPQNCPVPEAPSEPWMPSGGYDSLSDLSVDSIGVIGLTGKAPYLVGLFRQYEQSSKQFRSPELASAFVSAVAHQARRALMVVRPIFKTLAALEELDQEGQEKLATLLADICCPDAVQILFERSAGTKMTMLFYHALIKAVTESAKLPDLNLAVKIGAEMVAQGYKHTSCSTRMIMMGFTRNPSDNIGLQTCLNIMDWRLNISSSNIEACFANHFYSVLEQCSGAQVPECMDYLESVLAPRAPELERNLIAAVSDPNKAKSECCTEGFEGSVYFLVDPFTLNLPSAHGAATPHGSSINGAHPVQQQQSSNSQSGKDDATPVAATAGNRGAAADGTEYEAKPSYVLPKDTYVMFLYSAVRDICQKCATLGDDHPLQNKLQNVKNLLRENPQNCWVLSMTEELDLRPPNMGACVSPHCRMIAFATGVSQCMNQGSCTFGAVTADPGLEAAIRRRVPEAQVKKHLPLQM